MSQKAKIISDEQLAAMAAENNMEAQELLIQRYRDVVRIKASKYYMLGAEEEDLIQEGMIGLFKAINSYSGSKGASFKTYMNICINNQILKAIESSNANKHRLLNESVSLDAPVSEDDRDTTLGEMLSTGGGADPMELYIYREAYELMLEGDSRFFSDFEKQVARGLRKGKNYREIAEELGKSPKSVDNAISRIKKKVKDFFNE